MISGAEMGINEYLLYFVYAFTTVFVIVNPIEATMIFVTLTADMNALEKSHVYRRTTLVAFSIAILFSIAGEFVLRIFGITVDSLRVAGGILLFLVAIDMLRGVRQQKKVTEAELRDANQREDVSVFPLAIPLLTGPGAITTVVVLMGAASTIVEEGTGSSGHSADIPDHLLRPQVLRIHRSSPGGNGHHGIDQDHGAHPGRSCCEFRGHRCMEFVQNDGRMIKRGRREMRMQLFRSSYEAIWIYQMQTICSSCASAL